MSPKLFLELEGRLTCGCGRYTKIDIFEGACGTRVLQGLQSYGETASAYEENAYTYSSTYHDGARKVYVHHAVASGGRPEYHKAKIVGEDNRGKFIVGTTAFTNAWSCAVLLLAETSSGCEVSSLPLGDRPHIHFWPFASAVRFLFIFGCWHSRRSDGLRVQTQRHFPLQPEMETAGWAAAEGSTRAEARKGGARSVQRKGA